MEFVRVPVADYLVEVDGFTVPSQGDRTVLESFAPMEFAPSSRIPAGGGAPAAARSPRILELLALAETAPGVASFTPYLADPDPKVRRAAVATLTETVPEGFAPVLAGALDDAHASVRHAAAAALRELVEVVPPGPDLAAALCAPHADPVARAACLDVLRALRLGDPGLFQDALTDQDQRVRLQAVRGLVSLDAAGGVAQAAADPSREVRITVAAGLGQLAAPAAREALRTLAADADPLVRAAALKAFAAYDGAPEISVDALADPSWEVRAGAAAALAAAPARGGDLAGALADPHLDVRKAAVIALAAHPAAEARDAALTGALADSDADVRAYARRALEN
ncbi:hypothetical protein GCM10022221_45890 [Actinocorallia aurea]